MSDNYSAARATAISITCGALLTLVACGGGSGSSGASSVVTALYENAAPVGTCPNGGAQLDSGIDDNRNGTLDAEEIDQTQYICNGTDGQNTLVAITSEPAGINCATGGSKVEAGLDLDGDGVLDAGEVTSTTYVCTGPQGPGVSWVEATGDVQAAANTGYMTNSGNLVTVTLPVAPALGDIVKVTGVGQGGWRIAQNAGQVIRTTGIPSSYGLHWDAGTLSARAVASSADGKKLVAAVYGGKLQTSTDYGATWTARDATRSWWNVASSADGTKLAATVMSGQIYTSTDAGATWTARESNRVWNRIVSSQDGTVLAAVASGNENVFISTDSGVTWTTRLIAAGVAPQDIAIAMNGARMIVGTSSGFYVSQDAGLTWTAHDTDYTVYMGVASSAVGDTQVARAHIGPMLISHDAGNTWASTNLTEGGGAVACSDDGKTMVIVAGQGAIHTSYDSGINWNLRGQTGAYSVSAASSADGSRLVISGTTSGNGNNATLYHSVARTTTGTSGAILGDQFESIELQYIGNGTFTVLGHEGDLTVE